ncbi:MAG: hypothetical protein H7Z43_05850, partial [Clostridia bacterium]|nr:hypothetical protein [Deltaproteobacteria bacterium]
MGQKTVAIDVSRAAVRIVALEATFRKAMVTMVTTVPIPPMTAKADVWSLVRDYVPQDADNIVVSSDARASSTRWLQFPFVDPRKVDAAVEFELEGVVPYELEKTGLAWHIGRAADGKTDVIAAMQSKETVRELIGTMAAVGLEPRLVVLPAAALSELVPDAAEATAVIAVGETTTHFAILRRGLIFARTLRVGLSGGELTNLPALIREIGTTLHTLNPDAQPQSVLVTGGASRIIGLTAALEDRLGVPVTLLDIAVGMAPVELGEHGIGPEYAIAAGLAVATLRRGRHVPLNFRRGDLAYHGDLQVYRGEIVRIAVGLGAVLMFAMIGAIVQYTMVSAEDRQLNQGFCDASKKIIGREVCDPNAVMAIMRQSPGAGDGIIVPTYSASSLLAMMSQSLEGV